MIPLVLADDLTGALDSGVAFTGGGPLRVALRPGDDRARIVNLGAREIGPDSAFRVGRFAGLAAAGAPHVLLKIDSLLRGPWPQLLAGVLAAGGFARCVFAPALPAQGRVMRDGRQWVQGAEGGETLVGADPVAALAAEGVAAARWRSQEPPGAPVLIRDAATDDDLAVAAAQAAALPGRTLWCGSGGLAAALAESPPTEAAPPRGSLLAVIGTRAPATLAQVGALRAWLPLSVFDLGADASASAAALGARPHALATFALPPDMPHAAAGAEIAARLAALVPLLRPPSTLFVSGGETLAALCAAAGADALSLLGCWRPGAPLARLIGGRWDGVTVVSKSGAFGGPALLADLWRATGSAQP